MEAIYYKNIKEGEIYTFTVGSTKYIFKPFNIKKSNWNTGANVLMSEVTNYDPEERYYESTNFTSLNHKDFIFYEAIESERRWLNYCIKIGGYIDKTEVPLPDQDILDLEKLIEESNKYL
jgi:hypothetical protein